MEISIKPSFKRDSKKLNFKVQTDIKNAIVSINTGKITQIPECPKMTLYKNAYRIKTGRFCIGFYFENNTVELARILDRKDIYKWFPAWAVNTL